MFRTLGWAQLLREKQCAVRMRRLPALPPSSSCWLQRSNPITRPAPSLQAVLSAKGGDSVFKVVETNDFKQLPHITLTFRPGNDTAVKQVCRSMDGGMGRAVRIVFVFVHVYMYTDEGGQKRKR